MRVFHCFTCDRTYKEMDFAQMVLNKDKESIIREYTTKEELKNDTLNWEENQHKFLLENKEVLDKLYNLKINQETITNLKLGYIANSLATPVFKNGELINIARYNINKIPNLPSVIVSKINDRLVYKYKVSINKNIKDELKLLFLRAFSMEILKHYYNIVVLDCKSKQ